MIKKDQVGLIAQFVAIVALCIFCSSNVTVADELECGFIIQEDETDFMATISHAAHERAVLKKQLDNGMTVLICPTHTIPHVSLQIWYNVGSKDENTGEKGIAHFIEHMIFKGTQGKGSLNLSESDINVISHKLSARCNAFTAQDFTGYKFDVPAHHWQEMLPIMADCMLNASFKDQHINSEMKAVIQELKMRRDNYVLSLAEAMLSSIFIDHPYHYPIIGFKQDLWNMHSKDLHAFYKKHYVPNNATLVVVGDVNPDEAFALIAKQFGTIKPNNNYKRKQFFHGKDVVAKGITMYRDVMQPAVLAAFVIPGIASKNKPILDIASWVLGMGKGSRLYKKIVDEQQLATSLTTFCWDILFEHSLFFVVFEPKKTEDIPAILATINQEIKDIVTNGLPEAELERAVKKARMAYYDLLEDNEEQAYELGKFFLATGDESFVFNYLQEPYDVLSKKVTELFTQSFRPSVMHVGKVLPLPENEKATWAMLQKESDEEDARFLSARVRTEPIEGPLYANTIDTQLPKAFEFPKPERLQLSNGLKVMFFDNPTTPKINLELRFKAKDCYDPEKLQGLYTFMASMLLEGTHNYTAAELAQELESRGMSLRVYPGGVSMSMLSSDLSKGLELLVEVLTQANFDEQEIEKVREQMLAELTNFWDDPATFSGHLIKQRIYAGHPYAKNSLGSKESVRAITQKELKDFYKQYISPQGATLALVGDLSGHNVGKELEAILSTWQGPVVHDLQCPPLAPAAAGVVDYTINRDQVVLCFASPSIDRNNPDYDKLQIFDQILAGGVLGSMNSRLFKLREHTGLFYSIGGSLIAGANEQPGMIVVKTKVSLDRLSEAEKAIKNTLAHVADTLTPQELAEAKNALINSLTTLFASNASIASAFLFLDRYNLPDDYYDKRPQQLAKITATDVQAAVKRVLKADQLATFRIGRVG